MNENKPIVRTNPVPEKGEDLSETRRVSMKEVAEEIPLERRFFLEIHHPGLKSISIELDGQDTSIGRGSKCRIQLKVDNASRLHARLVYSDEEYFIEVIANSILSYFNNNIIPSSSETNKQINVAAKI